MFENCVNRLLVSVHDLKDSFRCTRLEHQLGKHDRNRRVALRRLQDECVSAGDRRRELPHRYHCREVERRDAGDDTERLAHGVHVDSRAGAVGEFAFQHLRGANAEFHNLKTSLDVPLGVGNGLSVLRRQCPGQLIHVPLQKAHEFHQHPGPALGIRGRPSRLGVGGGVDSGIHFLRIGQRHLCLHLAGCRIENIAKTAGSAFNATSVDEMCQRLHILSSQEPGRRVACVHPGNPVGRQMPTVINYQPPPGSTIMLNRPGATTATDWQSWSWTPRRTQDVGPGRPAG